MQTAADKSGIQWKSALMGGDDDVSTSRSIPGKKIKGARWTQFGKFGYLRLQTSQGSNTRHELRFDGFDPKAVDQLRDTLKNFYDVNLEKHSMSASGVSYGKCEVEGRNLVFRHMLLEDANEEGEEFEPRVNDELLSLDLAEVSQCVLPGNNRHEVELQFPESDTVEAGTDQLGELMGRSRITKTTTGISTENFPNTTRYNHFSQQFRFGCTFLLLLILRTQIKRLFPMLSFCSSAS
jgi:hypothetical protein